MRVCRHAGFPSRPLASLAPVLAAALLTASLTPRLAAAAEGRFLPRTTTVGGRDYRWQVFAPAAVLSGEERNPPVILFLHGAGERGSDGEQQLEIGLPAVLRERPDFPALVVMPQAPRNAWWGSPEIEELAVAALDAAVAEFGGDPDRTYLTGLSLGGYGTWAFAYRNPGRFAALVPVCGGVAAARSRLPVPDWHPAAVRPDDPWTETAEALADIPAWIFHGALDRRVPVEESRRMVAALEAAGGAPRYTEYPDVAHRAWVPAYREEGLYEWLLAQRRTHR